MTSLLHRNATLNVNAPTSFHLTTLTIRSLLKSTHGSTVFQQDRIQLDYENPAAFWKAFAANLPSNLTGPRNRVPLTRQLLLRTLQFHRTERCSREERPRLSSKIHNILLWQPCRNYQKPPTQPRASNPRPDLHIPEPPRTQPTTATTAS